MNNHIIIKKDKNKEAIFRNGKFDGEVIHLDNNTFHWRNILADKINNKFTSGISHSRYTAFINLGYKT